jgi:hypothetical protein
METRLVKLKSDFNDIINIRNVVKNVFDTLQIRIDRLRQIYAEFIKTNKSEMFVFGLDSFHFQSKLIDIEYDDMKRLFLAINNRMYCEYFKLHKIIVEYISKNVTDKKVSDLVKITNFPTYKDLEPFKEYKFEIILDIHENILNLLGILISILNNKENELTIHKTKQKIGLNIDNFITSFNFNISVMREKIVMFITYIEFFHKMHSKYLKRFSNKIQLMYTHISNDIKLDDSVEISKNKKKELIDEFSTNNIDKSLLKDLKTSIGSETNSEVSNDSKSISSILSDKPNSLMSLAFSTNQNSDNISLQNSSPLHVDKEKKYKKIFQKNIHKVVDILNIFNPKKDKTIDPSFDEQNNTKITDKVIEEMFYDIEESCDSIINSKLDEPYGLEPENIQLKSTSVDSSEKEIKLLTSENVEKNNEEESVIKQEENAIVEENTIVEEVQNEKVEAINDEENKLQENSAPSIEPVKKKRAYNRKKK